MVKIKINRFPVEAVKALGSWGKRLAETSVVQEAKNIEGSEGRTCVEKQMEYTSGKMSLLKSTEE